LKIDHPPLLLHGYHGYDTSIVVRPILHRPNSSIAIEGTPPEEIEVDRLAAVEIRDSSFELAAH